MIVPGFLPGGFSRYRIAGCVDVWNVLLDDESCGRDSGWESLSDDERKRARNFGSTQLRERFVAARVALRMILGFYLERRPRDVRLTYGAYGKPALDDAPAPGRFEFNVSHSGGRAVVAVTQGRPVGVDLEHVRANFDVAEIVERFFSAAERRSFAALPLDLQPAAFYHAWTGKEAYLKALGAGLHLPLHDFDVSVDPRQPAHLLKQLPSAFEPYALHSLPVPAQYAGTLAVALQPSPIFRAAPPS